MRLTFLAVSMMALLVSAPYGGTKGEERSKAMNVKKLTLNLYAEDVEPCVKFWVERLGFEKVMEVPDGNKLAFALLKKGSLELMYGSYASLEKAPDGAVAFQKGTTFLYVEVENLNEVVSAMKGVEVVKAVHTTPYGAKELSVKDPAGHVITFAQMGAAAQQ